MLFRSFIPFMTKELRMDGAALYYGMNALSNNVIMADRKRLKNPKGLYHKGTGTPRKTQAAAPFAAQMGRQPQKERSLTVFYYTHTHNSIRKGAAA